VKRVSRKHEAQSRAIADALGLLGHPGFFTLFTSIDDRPSPDPAVVLVAALSCEDLDPRIVEALPWLVLRFSHLDWDWTVREVCSRKTQNRLGFVVSLALQLGASSDVGQERLVRLSSVEEELFSCRIEREDTLCARTINSTRKEWLRETRSEEAKQWGLLTDLRAADLDCPEV
jgi:hypothetical protein